MQIPTVLLLILYSSDAKSADSKPAARIIKGKDCPEEEYSRILYLLFASTTDPNSCGGSLVNENWVLTAGHCIKRAEAKDDDKIFVLNSTNHVLTSRTAVQLVVHEKFDLKNAYKDIALVKLNEPLTESSAIRYALLPDRPIPGDVQDIHKTVLAMGLGDTTPPSASPKARIQFSNKPHLQCAVIDVVPVAKCFEIDPKMEHYIVCVHSKEGKGTCQGDSGSPIWAGKVQVGLVSGGWSQCDATVPEYYTRVDKYLDWIVEHTAYFYSVNGKVDSDILKKRKNAAGSIRAQAKVILIILTLNFMIS